MVRSQEWWVRYGEEHREQERGWGRFAHHRLARHAAIVDGGERQPFGGTVDGQQPHARVPVRADASAFRADANAIQAQQTADSARVTAEAANTQAVISAVAAKVQADALIRVSDQSHTASLATLITSCFGFLTLIAGFVWKAYTDSRDHRWVMETTAQAATVTALHRQTELQKISEVQTSAQAAYSEANTVNKKIESIGLKMADSKPLNPADKETPPIKK